MLCKVVRSVSRFLLVSIGLWGCGGDGNAEGPMRGRAVVVVDPTLRPAIELVAEAFERSYPQARLELRYQEEARAVAALLADSVAAAIVTRPFSVEESTALAEQRIRPKQVLVAWDGLALVAHPSRSDSLLKLDSLRAWLQRPRPPYRFVVEGGSGSGIYRYIRDSLCGGQALLAPLYRADSVGGVFAYVQQEIRALGWIGAAWVCDREDSTAQRFTRTVRVYAIAPSGASDYYFPYAGWLRPGYYPLVRTVYALNREPRQGVATSFIAYLAGPEGQRILLKSGLFPARAPTRIIELKEQTIP